MLPARLARLHAAVNRQSGERVRIRPRRGGGYTVASDDPTRPPADIIAYVARSADNVRTSGNAANSGHNVELRAMVDTIKFTTSDLAYSLEAGDLVDMLDEPDAPSFRVSRTLPFGTDRTVAFLVPVA